MYNEYEFIWIMVLEGVKSKMRSSGCFVCRLKAESGSRGEVRG